MGTSVITIQDAGAVGDGSTLNTEAIQGAIDSINAQGGGTLLVTPGTYISGMLKPCSNLTIEIQPGATIKASGNPEHYPVITTTMGIVSPVDKEERHFIFADHIHNFKICGGGALDGNGMAFWDPPSNCDFYTPRSNRVTRMIELHHCEDVILQNIKIIDSPGWTVHVHECNNLRIQGVDIRNNLYGPNTDGIDITDSADIFVSDCTIYAGDDAIVLKSYGGINERIHVTNCMTQTNCSALKLGANESFGTIRQITMSNCVVRNSSRGISLYCMGGGTFEDVTFSNIVMECDNEIPLVNPIHIHASRNPDEARARGIGKIRNVNIGDILCKTDARILLTCEDGNVLENIHLHDIHMDYPKIENEFEWARSAEGNLQFSPFVPDARAAKACIVAYNIMGLTLRNITASWPAEPGVGLHFLWARKVENGFIDCPLAAASDATTAVYDIADATIQVR